MPASLELQIKTLPNEPGVYQYFDKEDVIIYIGKAKNLKKRVASYFNKNHENGKTRVLVKKIVLIKHIVVHTETDALLLENNLIKKYKPRYNVLLKDDKSYPWICIKKERFPRVFMTRRVIKDGSEYYGPYTSVRTVRVLLDLIKELYPLRTCTYDLSYQNINEGTNAASLGKALKISTELVAAVVVGSTFGVLFDKWFGTKPVLTICFFLIGVAAGILNVFKAAKKMNKKL